MKNLVSVIALISAFAVVAAPEVAKSQQQRPKYADGSKPGMVVKPGSQKGVFTFINTQQELPRAEIESAARQAAEALMIKVVVSDAKPGDPETLVKASGGALGIVVVADDATPAMLIAPEDGWGVVNVKKLDKFATPESRAKSFGVRCNRELVRAFAMVAGGTCSEYAGNLCSYTKIEELELSEEGLPVDKIAAAQRFLKSRGYAPAFRAPYYKACKEGWAPQPTNDAQRAIWKRVHELPSKPITIKYDPKRDK